MLKEIIIFALAVVSCHGDIPTPSQGVYCGRIPENIYSCLSLPSFFTQTVASQCTGSTTPCSKFTCLFNKAGWIKDDKVDKKKALEYYDSFVETHPQWTSAVNHAKAACLGDRVLPAQGVHLNCPAYDTLQCTLSSFFKNASPSQWRQTPECQATKSFAAACPVCPNECFGGPIPNDSCHACLALPRSA